MEQLLQERNKIVNHLHLKEVDSETLADDTLFFDGRLDLNPIDLTALRQAIQVR